MGFIIDSFWCFYAYAGVKFLIYIIATILSTYLFSIKISQSHEAQELYLKENKSNLSEVKEKNIEKSKRQRWKLLVFCLIINLVYWQLLICDFTIANINSSFFFNIDKQLILQTLLCL